MGDWSGDNRVVKIILISVGLLAFISLIASSYQIMGSNSPDILKNCIKTAVSVKNETRAINSAEEGAQLISDSLGDKATFAWNTLEVCDARVAGYVYKAASNKTYAVCGDGKIYLYEDVCTSGELAKSFVSMLSGNK